MAKTRINRFLFILQILFVNSIITIFILNFHKLPQIYSAAIFLFLLPAAILGIFMAVIKKYIKAYRTYRDLILMTLGISALSLWLPMLIAIFTGPQEYGKVLRSKIAHDIEIRDIPQNADALWITFNEGILLYDLKGEYHETEKSRIKDSSGGLVNTFYIYPLVSRQWTFDEPIQAFICEKATNKQEDLENWNLPYLLKNRSHLSKNGGLMINNPSKLKVYSRALLKLAKTKDIKISPNVIFIEPIEDFQTHYKQSRISFYLFYILVNLFWVGTTGLGLWINRRKTIQYVNFDIMQ
ncbi:MAG: hypothetical protein KAI79_01545 [Bacteroidales bacterium]|nr:hypothetical protein [Bacteroidales bacterium]